MSKASNAWPITLMHKARAKRASSVRSRSLVVTVHEGGTRWGTTGGPDE